MPPRGSRRHRLRGSDSGVYLCRHAAERFRYLDGIGGVLLQSAEGLGQTVQVPRGVFAARLKPGKRAESPALAHDAPSPSAPL